MNNATEKQKAAVERLRKRCGDDMLLHRAKVGKWSEHEFDLDNLTKDEAQRIITTAPSKPIYGIHAPFGTNVVQCPYQEGLLYRKVEEVLQGTFSNLEY